MLVLWGGRRDVVLILDSFFVELKRTETLKSMVNSAGDRDL